MKTTRGLELSKTKVAKRIEINMKQCGRCAICIEFCSRGVLGKSKDGLPEVVNLEQCTLCRLCELLCPDLCIFVKEETS